MMKHGFAVFLGGGFGACLRYLCVQFLFRFDFFRHYTWCPIMLINVLGSFIMGVSYIVMVKYITVNAYWRGLIMIGLLGGFTTFSSFSLDAVVAAEYGNYFGLALNVCLSVAGSLLMCMLGIYCAKVVLNYAG